MDQSSITPEAAVVSKKITPAKVPVTPVQYHGKNGEIFRLHILNLLMNIITLGIYSFWGKTRIRKYMTSHLTIAKERFEYTGTGGELLIGWLKAMVIFVPLFICLYIPIVNFVAIIGFLTILSLAIFLALRYRLSRTKWRGIKFALRGSLKTYFGLALKRTLANIFTLGYKIYKSDIILWSYIANNMSYGDIKFNYEGDPKRIKKIHLMTYLPMVFAFLILIGGGGYVGAKAALKNLPPPPPITTSTGSDVQNIAPQSGSEVQTYDPSQAPPQKKDREQSDFEKDIMAFVGIFYILFGLGFIGRLWYHAALWQEKFRGLRLGNLRFKSDVTGGGLIKLMIGNLLLIIFTLGLARPIALNRTMRYYASHMRIGGDLSELIATQDKSKSQSGMGDALAADVGFDLGL